MLKCKNCGEMFPGIYLPEDIKKVTDPAIHGTTSHTCSRGHKNECVFDDYMDWSGLEEFWKLKIENPLGQKLSSKAILIILGLHPCLLYPDILNIWNMEPKDY